ncbi:hypothetical protein GCM10027404_27170 [Arthrobacter tumbae]|uniref:hypothetical protein n=1 Tax=Arthrobacter tumbae TaxID=163874 RepID=UPI001957E14C|nr:hypothetical protein [Arthrobacter tumbae]MBM7781739.1 hypothetical protein [Arthrobacter tumbae]
MTLLASRPLETTEIRAAKRPALPGGAYVTTQSRPATTGSYVTTQHSGMVPADAIRGRYVSLGHRAPRQTEGRYTDRG